MPTDEEQQQQQQALHQCEWSLGGAKTFAFLPIDGHGHVNAMIGLADQLRSFGHRTVFICNDSTSAKYFGHELVLVRGESCGDDDDDQQEERQSSSASCTTTAPAAETVKMSEEQIFIGDERLNSKWAQMVDLLDLDVNKPECVVKSLTHNYSLLKLTIEQEIMLVDERIEQILIDLRPDLLVVDQLTPIPAVRRLSAAAATNSATTEPGASGIVGNVAPDESGGGGGGNLQVGKQQQQQEEKKPLRWISLCSCNPMPLYHAHSSINEFPPPLMGLSARMESGVGLEVEELRYERTLKSSGMMAALARLAAMAGIDAVEDPAEFGRFCRNESPYLNLYMCPSELDYAGERNGLVQPLPTDRYHRVDCLIRAPKALTSEEELLLGQVEKLRHSGGGGNECKKGEEQTNKCIVVYVSMGTTMSLNLKLVESMLAQVFACLERDQRWRFVVALGARANLLSSQTKLELERWQNPAAEGGANKRRLAAANWWPQPELMRRKLIDLAVVHGGNNTICELFHFGIKQLLVVPAFHDQLDNARRVADLGLGVSLPATKFLFSDQNDDDCDDDDLLLLDRSLRQTVELAEARSTSASWSAKWPSSAATAAAAGGEQLRDAYHCARLLESKLVSWTQN